MEESPILIFKNSPDLYIDAQKLPQGCVIRYRREGDIINKLGGGGRASLKEFLLTKNIGKTARLDAHISQKQYSLRHDWATISEDVKVVSRLQKFIS